MAAWILHFISAVLILQCSETFSTSDRNFSGNFFTNDCELISYIPGVNSSCCALNAIKCNENGRIISIKFNYMGLDSLDKFSLLEELTHLDLAYNVISNLEPVSRLKNLVWLKLSMNNWNI